MKAIVYESYGSPEVLQLKEVAKPIPKDHELLIKVKATTVTVADVRARGFIVPRAFWLPARISLGMTKPKKEILGMEVAGVVEAVGKQVKTFNIGDEVFAATLVNFGGYAEYICLPENGPVSLKPSNATFEEAAAIPIGARTALFFLRKANIKPGQQVLVYGASGSVGTYAVQLANYFGAHVTGICSTKNKIVVKSLGADKVIDYTKEDFSKDGTKYDVIFEAVDKSSFSTCIDSLKEGGTYINITPPLPDMKMIWAKITSGKRVILSQNSPETAEALVFLKSLFEEEKLKAVIDQTYTMQEIRKAHHYVEKGHKVGNVVLTIE
ncbi:NAD(P)-dependent alcohol dehydrogenase [Bacillus sp. BGMRC 2118]|nr:NAD(P)-dependent alcohol dehydrogenase [Bacillus sp. BGMRC 2118]